MKKAQGLSLNTIVIAAIVLIVLVVLLVIFLNQTGRFGTTLRSCTSQGGICQASCNADQAELPGTDCEKRDDEKNKCCIDVLGQ
jgi:uncharacterized protein HemY